MLISSYQHTYRPGAVASRKDLEAATIARRVEGEFSEIKDAFMAKDNSPEDLNDSPGFVALSNIHLPGADQFANGVFQAGGSVDVKVTEPSMPRMCSFLSRSEDGQQLSSTYEDREIREKTTLSHNPDGTLTVMVEEWSFD